MKTKFWTTFAIVLTIMTGFSCEFFNTNNDNPTPVEPWEKYDKAAHEEIKKQQFDLAERDTIRSIEEVQKQNGIKGDRGSFELSRIYSLQGRYTEAEQARLKAFPYVENQLALHEIFWHYMYLIEIYQEQGKFDEARKAVDWLLQAAEKDTRDAEKENDTVHRINSRSNKFWIAYPAIGSFFIQIADYERAIPYLKEHADYCVKSRTLSQNVAKAKNRLAMAYYYAGNVSEAERLYRDAAGLNTNALVGFPVDLAQSLTMLGRIAEHQGHAEQAAKYYQDALQTLHMYLTLVYKVEESDIWNQIGRLNLKQGQPGESANAYHKAIQLRQETATAMHPNCADAFKGLADVAACRNEWTSATLQAEKALKILDASVVPTHPRLAPELVALASIDTLSGHPDQAVPLFARLETILQKPLGPWKEDFLEATSFYVGLLNKAGQTDAAQHLKQLQSRQKEQR